MKRSLGKSFFIIPVVLVLAFSLLGVTTAYADDATPPPATEEPIAPPVDETGGDGAGDENAIIADETIVEEVAEPNDDAATEEVVTEDVVVEEATSVESQECIPQPIDGEALPEGSEAGIPCVTEERIIGENGIDTPVTSGGESLASAADAETLFTGDPMWCPAGVLPGGAGCTPSFASFDGAGGLIAALEAGKNTYAGAGTIYISQDYNVNEYVRLNYGDIALTDLVFQGGWDFTSNSVVGNTNFIKEVNFYDWGGYGRPGSLTINDISIQPDYSTMSFPDGLYIGDSNDKTTANVTLNRVRVFFTDAGATIETTGDATVNDSTFYGHGLRISSPNGTVTLNNINARWNLNDAGIYISTDGNVILNKISSNSNDGDGVRVTGYTDAYAGSVTVNGNNRKITDNGNGSYTNAYGLNISACNLNFISTPNFSGNQSGDVFFSQDPACANSGEDTGEKKKPKTATTSSSSALCAVSELTAGDVRGSLNNLCGITVLMSETLEEDLPAELSDEMTFHLGVKITAIGLPTGGYIKLYFPVPEDVDAENLVVLFWNETEWVETLGGEVVDGFLVIKVSEPGVYVLSSK